MCKVWSSRLSDQLIRSLFLDKQKKGNYKQPAAIRKSDSPLRSLLLGLASHQKLSC
jgi:hypothetical protein